MNLFISSFKRERPVLGLVVLALAACEGGLRLFGTSASIDLQHIQEIPQIVETMKKAGNPTLLFLGNSLTRRAVDPEVLAGELTRQSIPVPWIVKIHPDDSKLTDWHYLYERFVLGAGAAPDVLVVGFAENQLGDSEALHIDRLGGFFAGRSALPEIFQQDIQDFENRTAFLLASLSVAFANRDRVRTEFLGLLIPHYRTSAQTLNRAVPRAPRIRESSAPPYKRLDRFLQLARTAQTRVLFVAIPVPIPYVIDPALESVLRAHQAGLIDLRRMNELPDSPYLDGYHLTPESAAVVSRELAGHLRDALTTEAATGK